MGVAGAGVSRSNLDSNFFSVVYEPHGPLLEE